MEHFDDPDIFRAIKIFRKALDKLVRSMDAYAELYKSGSRNPLDEWAEYKSAGCPYGRTIEGFALWIEENARRHKDTKERLN